MTNTQKFTLASMIYEATMFAHKYNAPLEITDQLTKVHEDIGKLHAEPNPPLKIV